MSFQKKVRQALITGTKPSLHNGQTLTSTGNPSLDHILGGGQQLGTIVMIEEDRHKTYSETLLKYFMAEGVTQKHDLFVASLDENPNNLIKKLPEPILNEPSIAPSGDSVAAMTEDMRIAWRYNDLPQVNSVEETKTNFGHYFDLSKTIEESHMEKINITCWSDDSCEETSDVKTTLVKNPRLRNCIAKIHELAKKYPMETSTQLLRVAIDSLGSPYWYTDLFLQDLIKFLQVLKSIVRHSTSVCFITVPVHLLKYIQKQADTKLRSIVDYSIQLESFAGSDRETNPIFKDYHGLLYVQRIRAVNCPSAVIPKTKDLAFKLRRKKFVIEKLHLPPELQESEQREQDDIVPTLSCAGKNKHLLEF